MEAKTDPGRIPGKSRNDNLCVPTSGSDSSVGHICSVSCKPTTASPSMAPSENLEHKSEFDLDMSFILPSSPNPPPRVISIQGSKTRKGQTEQQEWMKQINHSATKILHEDDPTSKDKVLVDCFFRTAGCQHLSLVSSSLKKIGPYFCHEHFTRVGAVLAPTTKLLLPPFLEPTSSDIVVCAPVPTPIAEKPMFTPSDYITEVVPSATALPWRLEKYLMCVDFLNALPTIDCTECCKNAHDYSCVCFSYIPCMYIANRCNNNFTRDSASIVDYTCSAVYGWFKSGIVSCSVKLTNVMVYDEPWCLTKYSAPKRHTRVRYDTSQSYLSTEFSHHAKSAIIIHHKLQPLFDFYASKFISRRFNSDDECRRALGEALDDFPDRKRIPISDRDLVYNDTMVSYIWYKRQLGNARGNVLGAVKNSPDHITLG